MLIWLSLNITIRITLNAANTVSFQEQFVLFVTCFCSFSGIMDTAGGFVVADKPPVKTIKILLKYNSKTA